MTALTREKLDRLIDVLRDMKPRGGLTTAECQDLETIVVLLEDYPLPAAEGERGKLASILEEKARKMRDREDLWSPVHFATLERAAALLQAPATGIDKGRAVALVRKEIQRLDGNDVTGEWGPDEAYALRSILRALSAAIRALSEARPSPVMDVETLTE